MLDLDASTELCRLLGDPTRVRLVHLLMDEALTVAELVEVTRLSQSRISTHLGKLKEARLVRDRRAGSSSFYAANEGGMPPVAAALWGQLQSALDDPLLAQDRQRAREVVRARSGGARWADAVAGRMARHYSPGRTWEAAARSLLGLARLGRVLDIASGDGAIAELLAPRAEQVTCLDSSDKVIGLGRRRLAAVPNLKFVRGDMHALPFADASFDQALMLNSLSYTTSPERILVEAARVLTPGGALVGAALRRHDHAANVRPYNHVHYGFEPDELAALVAAAGFDVDLCAVTSRERRAPHFAIITLHARRVGA